MNQNTLKAEWQLYWWKPVEGHMWRATASKYQYLDWCADMQTFWKCMHAYTMSNTSVMNEYLSYLHTQKPEHIPISQ